jgi:hypothetical protein
MPIVPELTPQEWLNQDLGLDGKLSERSRVRLLNRDGTFNVGRNKLSPFHPYNAYHTLLSLSVPLYSAKTPHRVEQVAWHCWL